MAGNEGAPATQTEEEDAAAAHQQLEDAAGKLTKARKAGKANLPTLVGFRGFVAPKEQNTKFLANPDPDDNPVVRLPDQNSPTGKRDVGRENDVWVRFVHGSFVTDDPKAIDWCIRHPKICRDVSDPLTSTWFMMRFAQEAIASRPATLPAETDVDAALAGDVSKLGGEAPTIAATRAFTEQANEREPVEA